MALWFGVVIRHHQSQVLPFNVQGTIAVRPPPFVNPPLRCKSRSAPVEVSNEALVMLRHARRSDANEQR